MFGWPREVYIFLNVIFTTQPLLDGPYSQIGVSPDGKVPLGYCAFAAKQEKMWGQMLIMRCLFTTLWALSVSSLLPLTRSYLSHYYSCATVSF